MNINKKAVLGIKWTTASTISISIVAITKIAILTRLLDKSDFGLMALIMFIMGFVNLFSDMGISVAILHKKNITIKQYSSLYWFNFIISFALLYIIYLIAPFVARFYNEPELQKLIPIMGISFIINSIGNQYKLILEKKLEFKTLSITEISSSLLSLVFSVFLAYNNFKVYSLIYSLLLQYLITNVTLLVIGYPKNKIKAFISFSETKFFLKIGIYKVGGQIINYFNKELDSLIIGKLLGTEILGSYSLAKQLVAKPSQIINPVLTRVVTPVLVKFQSNLVLLKKHYLNLINVVSFINTIAYLIVIIFTPLLVDILYGNDYANIHTIVRILSVYMIVRSIGNPIGSLIVATGRTDIEFRWNFYTLAVTPIAIYIGAKYNIEIVAISLLISMIILFIPSWKYLIFISIKSTLKEYLQAIFDYKKAFLKIKTNDFL